MKMRLRVTLHNEDESEVTEATTMEIKVPDFEAFDLSRYIWGSISSIRADSLRSPKWSDGSSN